MNKKFFTLMAAVLIGGAAMPSDAFAAAGKTLTKAPVISLDGAKFYLGQLTASVDTAVYAVQDSAAYAGYKVIGAGSTAAHKFWKSPADSMAVFEVRNYNSSNKTFELWVGDKQFAYTAGTKKLTTFLAWNSTKVTDKTDFDAIKTAELGVGGNDIAAVGKMTPLTAADAHDATSLNAYRDLQFSFPDAVNMENTVFDDEKLYAIDAAALNTRYSSSSPIPSTSGDSVVFVVANEAGKKLMNTVVGASTVTDAMFNAADFVVLDQHDSYGITGLAAPAGLKFAIVKGEKLKATGNADKGEIAGEYARFLLTEGDLLNATGEMNIGIQIAGQDYKVGAYQLTAGGLKSYVTAIDANSDASMSNAWIGAGEFADVTALLKADGQAVYNIFFTGEHMPAVGDRIYKYGKYMAMNAGATDTAFYAPAKVDKSIAEAQWIVSSVGSKGQVTFLNAGDLTTTVAYQLYTTDEQGLYKLATPFSDADQIKLEEVTANNTFVEFTDDQLAENVSFSFLGDGSIQVSRVYLEAKSGAFQGTQNADKNYDKFTLKKGDLIKKGYNYAYKNGNILGSKTDSLAVQSYILMNGDRGLNLDGGTLTTLTGPAPASSDSLKLVFKNDIAGHLHAFAYNWNYGVDTTYTNRVVKGHVLNVNTGNAQIDSTDIADSKLDYCNITYAFAAEKGTSLPSTCKHVTFVGKSGAISWDQTDKALEGVLGFGFEPMVFWLDTADSDKECPSFIISKAVPAAEEVRAVATEPDRWMLFNPAQYINYWDPQTASYKSNDFLKLTTTEAKAVFAKGAITDDESKTMIMVAPDATTMKEASADDVKAFKFQITESEDGNGYVISSVLDNKYLYSLNGRLGFKSGSADAMVFGVDKAEATANEAIAAEAEVAVIAGNGTITVQGAAGKVITVANILGQTIANQVAASDNVTIAAPAGVVVVTVDGEATKVVVK